MKNRISLLLAVCLLLIPMMAKVSADNHDASLPIEPLSQASAPEMIFPAGSVPADSALLDGIHLPIHALVLSMTEHDRQYNIQSPEFIWNALYYALSMYGVADDRAQLTQEALMLPSEAVHDFARALFAQVEELPQIPLSLHEFVSYETATDTYLLSLGDFAETQTLLGELSPQQNGVFLLNGTLTALEDNAPLCTFRATLLENDTMFGFSILDVSLD